MTIVSERKKSVVKEFALREGDTGSPEVQIALITEHVANLTAHLKSHRKDFASRRGLLMKVNQRSKLLRYLRLHHPARYQAIVERLGLRR
jgi:small subunit ribosomal protein S15